MKKHLFIYLKFYILLNTISILLIGCNLIKAGSYANAENYYISLSNYELIEKLNIFIKNNPQYRYFSIDENGNNYEVLGKYQYDSIGVFVETTTRSDSATFYSCYFYFSDLKASILCIVRLNNIDDNITNLKLVSIIYDLKEENGSFNSGELSRKEEKKFKRKFETEILDKLGVVWKQ